MALTVFICRYLTTHSHTYFMFFLALISWKRLSYCSVTFSLADGLSCADVLWNAGMIVSILHAGVVYM